MGVPPERQDSGARSALLFLPFLQGSDLDVLGADMRRSALLSSLLRPARRGRPSHSGGGDRFMTGGQDGRGAVRRGPAHAGFACEVGDGKATIGPRRASVDEARQRLP